ncbi:hypothetical protein ANDA3_3728 [plant metagenome]|uniref:Uncharacterized protein n=1 Tax=plant metagenome TaxID=1297885 RepID=A0A484TAK9_9ZZZZ
MHSRVAPVSVGLRRPRHVSTLNYRVLIRGCCTGEVPDLIGTYWGNPLVCSVQTETKFCFER